MKKSANLNHLLKSIVLSFGCISLCFWAYIATAQLVGFGDATGIRRGLMLANATDTKWSFTMAYSILARLTYFWSDNIFYLRLTGLIGIALASSYFAWVSLSKFNIPQSKLTIFATVLVSGMGVFNYFPNSLPEYNHLAVFSALGIGANVVSMESRKTVSWKNLFALGSLFALFLVTNLPSALIILSFFIIWFLLQFGIPYWLKLSQIAAVTLISYALLYFLFNENPLGHSNPGVKYNELALKELQQFFPTEGNFLYLILRLITFGVEFVIVGLLLAGCTWLGRQTRDFRPIYRKMVFSIPLIWLLVSTWFTVEGFETYQVPSLWDFSPSFFLGKWFWYGYCTTLPLLIFMAFLGGFIDLGKLLKHKGLLLAFMTLLALAGCFASGARVVHKMQMYQWCLIFILFSIIQNIEGPAVPSPRKLSVYAFILVVLQSFFLQVVPIVKQGGFKSFNRTLAAFPRGRGVTSQSEFADWLSLLSETASAFGIPPNEPVLSNDYIAVYLLGLHQAVLPETNARFGILTHSEEQEQLDSRIDSSRLLKILGPPNLPLAKKEGEDEIGKYFQNKKLSAQRTIVRGKGQKSILVVVQN